MSFFVSGIGERSRPVVGGTKRQNPCFFWVVCCLFVCCWGSFPGGGKVAQRYVCRYVGVNAERGEEERG